MVPWFNWEMIKLVKSLSNLRPNYSGKAIRTEFPQHLCWFFEGNYKVGEYEDGFIGKFFLND